MRLDHPQTLDFIQKAGLLDHSRSHYTRAQKQALARLAAILLRPLTIGIAGEAGSGKSTLLNALLGATIVPAGGLGRVRPVFRTRYGEEYAAYSIEADGSRHRLTAEGFERASAGQAAFAESHPKVIYSARSISLPAAAKPGTGNALIEVSYPAPVLKQVELAELPASFVPASLSPAISNFARVDLAIWVTPAHQAWKRSELQAWQDLRLARPYCSIAVAAQMDGLAAAQDREKLMARLAQDTASVFKACYPVSAQQALDAFASPAHAAAFQHSGLPQLQKAIQELVLAIRQERLVRACAILERIETKGAGSRLLAATGPGQAANPELPAAGLYSVG
jgi:energy-coupling factor transporter ATP-binding protein EcfA2